MLMQVGALLIGGVLISVIMYIISNSNIRNENEKSVREALIYIEEEQERLRAWKIMGMESAVNEAVHIIVESLSLDNLQVIERSKLPKHLDSTQFISPNLSEKLFDEEYVLFGQIKPNISAERLFLDNSLLFLLVSFSALFIAILVFTSKYIQANIYSPIASLYSQLLAAPEESGSYLSSIPAKGEIGDFIDKITTVYNESKIKEKNHAKFKIARQVAHDIRSPLVALDLATQELSGLKEDTRMLIEESVKRIKDIANNLLSSNKANIEQSEVQLIGLELDKIVSEKRLQLKHKNDIEIHYSISENSADCFAEIESHKFQRCISNVLNNAIDALEGSGSIRIHLKKSPDKKMIVISISDNGKGIPQDKIDQVFQSGYSYGKIGGHGLGLAYLKESIDSFRGNLNLSSTPGQGTTLKIFLPAHDTPVWFADRIKVKPESTIVIVDDYKNIHDIWNKKFEKFNDNFFLGRIINFEKISEFEGWLQSVSNLEDFVFLIDFHFVNERKTGLDLILQYNLSPYSYLVTSQFDRPKIKKKLSESNTKSIPKQLVRHIPFQFIGTGGFAEINKSFYDSSEQSWLTDLAQLKGISKGEDLQNMQSFFNSRLQTGNEKVLEIGAGTGRVLKWFIANYPNPITGIDISKTNIQRCSKIFSENHQVELVLGNICSSQSIPADDYYLAIWAWSGIYELSLSEKRLALQQLSYSLKENAYFVIDLPKELKGGELLTFGDDNIVEQVSNFGVVKNQIMQISELIPLVQEHGFDFVDQQEYTTSTGIQRAHLVFEKRKVRNESTKQKLDTTISIG